MFKKNLKMIIITSVVTILPILAGIVLWQKLPESLPTHWGFSGEVDGWSSKPFAVFFIPFFMLIMHLICAFATSMDPKGKGINSKILTLVLWICPVISIVSMASVYMAGMGMDVKVDTIIPLFMGILFLVIGNYLPKCKQNYTIGIKLPWTLNDEENWNKTHRFAGVVWTICSIVIIVGSFFNKGAFYTTFPSLFVMVFAPLIYSYIYYRKHR